MVYFWIRMDKVCELNRAISCIIKMYLLVSVRLIAQISAFYLLPFGRYAPDTFRFMKHARNTVAVF